MPRYAFDERCAELAVYFLKADGTNTPEREAELAQEIQNAIEGYLFGVAMRDPRHGLAGDCMFQPDLDVPQYCKCGWHKAAHRATER